MIPNDDLLAIDAALAPLWPRLTDAHLFITGGTGFIGRWMLEALARAPVPVQATILSRDPARFAAKAPHLAARFGLVAGDVAAPICFPPIRITHVIHGATDASAALTANDPRRMFDTILTGTRHMLDIAREHEARFLFLSSGAVYGCQPPERPLVDEDWTGGPDLTDPRSAYAEGKRAAETLCAIYARQFGVETVVARIFALLGPLLSLDIHFAAGNFIRDAIAERPITVEGSGQAVRSYLYAADLAIWMWTLAIAARPGSVYNVGSEEAVSIADLATRIGCLLGAPAVDIRGAPDPGWNPGRYVPSTARITRDLGVAATVSLNQAILRTAAANGWKSRS